MMITSQKSLNPNKNKDKKNELSNNDLTVKKSAPKIPLKEFTGDTESEIDRYKFLFQKSVLDQKKEYPLPIPVIQITQSEVTLPLLTLKSFSLWQGKQKSKKTTVLAIIASVFIRGYCQDNFFSTSISGKIIYFDNEQGESYAARTMKLILKMAGVDYSDKFIYCDLREHAPSDRKKIIEAGIESTSDVKLVIIDGLVDLLDDFMDASEGHLTTTDILRWCSIYNIHIAGVLHQNKNDKNARAHIGTISSQKCEVEISTEVDPNDRAQSIVTCVNSRNIPFEPFAIRWDKGSLPCICPEFDSKKNESKTHKNFEQSKEIAEAIFRPFTALTHTSSIQSIMQVTNKSTSTAKRMLGDFLGWGFIEKSLDGLYRISSKGSGFKHGSNEGQ